MEDARDFHGARLWKHWELQRGNHAYLRECLALFPPHRLSWFVSEMLANPAYLLHVFPSLHVVLEDALACCTSSALWSRRASRLLPHRATSPNLVGPPPPPTAVNNGQDRWIWHLLTRMVRQTKMLVNGNSCLQKMSYPDVWDDVEPEKTDYLR